MEIVSNKPAYIENSFSFFSLLNISETAKRVTIKNAKYPLNDGEISCEYQYGISNEVVGEIAEISIREGKEHSINIRYARLLTSFKVLRKI